MLEEDEVWAHIETADRDFIFNVRIRGYDETILLYIPRDRVVQKSRYGLTTFRKISNIKKHLSERFSTDVQVIFVKSDSHSDLEAGFFQLLRRRFNDTINSLYISIRNENTIDTWIEAQDIDSLKKNRILEYYYEVLTGANFTPGETQWIGANFDPPSIPAILRLVKVLQPVEVATLSAALRENFDSADLKRLTTTLDSLRKKGLVHWQKPGMYTLTADSLALVPAGARRTSSDIDRALALGRRKW